MQKFIEDVKKFIENDINVDNKYLVGGCYLVDDTEVYTEIKVSFNTRQAENYKKLLAFLSRTQYIIVTTDLCTYATIIRAYK